MSIPLNSAVTANARMAPTAMRKMLTPMPVAPSSCRPHAL
jgi:hypothetical protein